MAIDQLQQDDQWQECPQGELSQMVKRVDSHQRSVRRQQIYGTAFVSTAVFACVVLALGSLFGPANNFYGGIRCAECRTHFADYERHATGNSIHEDAALMASVKVHLEKCTICRGKFNAMHPGVLSVSHSLSTRPVALLALSPTFMVNAHRATY